MAVRFSRHSKSKTFRLPVIPAQAGIHNHRLWNMDSSFRWNDEGDEVLWPLPSYVIPAKAGISLAVCADIERDSRLRGNDDTEKSDNLRKGRFGWMAALPLPPVMTEMRNITEKCVNVMPNVVQSGIAITAEISFKYSFHFILKGYPFFPRFMSTLG